ncbi:uncharacterized protein [Spinacia oleracea]|uniref:Retrotransposon gag domain-containing protein n=1 Tax=Spinacia oleracea TaxID=3562 RepID=A0A9R0HWI9_SPIOL|nr:uncharacterized protein LOC110778075 [Spinacia oleracea]
MAETQSEEEYNGGEERRPRERSQRHIEEANRVANAGNTPRRVQEAEVVVEEEPTLFMAHKEEMKTSMHLGRIQQGKYESLRSYMKRFNLEAGQIPDLPDGVSFDNFIRGLKKGSFKFDLVKKSVRTMAEVLDEAEAFIHAIEICSASKDGKTGEATDSSGKKDKIDRKAPRKLKESPRRPSLQRTPQNYLQRNTHGSGKSQYKKNKSHVSPTQGNHNEGGFVAVISGGPAAGGPTMRGHKDYARRLGKVMLSGKSHVDPFPRIEICESDGGRVATPHDDPLVVEIKISNMRVKRILIDTGSSSDIMSMECLSRLAHDPKNMESIHYPIIGFGGSIIHPAGVINLPVRIGDRKDGRKMGVNFLIVKDLTAYNVILGRPTLNKIKAVVVTHLMLLKFVCDDGAIGTIHGDQQQARECYLTTLNPSAWKKDLAKARSKRKHEEELPAVNESIPTKIERSG